MSDPIRRALLEKDLSDLHGRLTIMLERKDNDPDWDGSDDEDLDALSNEIDSLEYDLMDC